MYRVETGHALSLHREQRRRTVNVNCLNTIFLGFRRFAGLFVHIRVRLLFAGVETSEVYKTSEVWHTREGLRAVCRCSTFQKCGTSDTVMHRTNITRHFPGNSLPSVSTDGRKMAKKNEL